MNMDINDRKYIVNMIPPTNLDKNGSFSINQNKGLSNILLLKSHAKYQLDSAELQVETPLWQTQNFNDRRVTVKKAIAILAKSNIHVDENDAAVILNFLYLIAKSTKAQDRTNDQNNLKEKSNPGKTALLNNLSKNRPDLNWYKFSIVNFELFFVAA
jgi:hypothetical protein